MSSELLPQTVIFHDSRRDGFKALLVEGNPVGRVLSRSREQFLDRSVVFSVPGVIPSPSHVAIKSILCSQFLKAVKEMAERKRAGAVYDAELSSDFTEGSIAVDPFRLYASFEPLPVMEQHALAVSHSAFIRHLLERGFGVLVRIVVEMPSAFPAPGEDSVIGAAFVSLMEFPGRNVMARYVGMLEFVQELSGERGRADEDDVRFTFFGHLFRHKVNPRELRIINRKAVMVFHPDTRILPGSLPRAHCQSEEQRCNDRETVSHTLCFFKNHAKKDLPSSQGRTYIPSANLFRISSSILWTVQSDMGRAPMER